MYHTANLCVELKVSKRHAAEKFCSAKTLVANNLCYRFLLKYNLIRQELIDKTNARVSLFVKKLKIPFWIISCLIFSMELVSSTLRGTYYPLSVLTTLTGILYIVSETGLSILYFVSGKTLL